jgi:hypothetical protein
MWERITPADLRRAKSWLSLNRAETLSRHAEEIKRLDAQLQDIESFERVVAAFVEEYMNPEAVPEPAAVSDEEPTPTVGHDALTSGNVQQDEPLPDPQVHQEVSPNFGIPLRRFVGR